MRKCFEVMIALALLVALSFAAISLAGESEREGVKAEDPRQIEKEAEGSGARDEDTSDQKNANSYYIRIDTEDNRVTVYQKSGDRWEALATKACATGKPSTPTPRGVYHVTWKDRSFFKNGASWNYVTYFYENYAIHSTGEIEGRYDNHALGKRASHGCVRLKPEDARWIYENIPVGTPVEVV